MNQILRAKQDFWYLTNFERFNEGADLEKFKPWKFK